MFTGFLNLLHRNKKKPHDNQRQLKSYGMVKNLTYIILFNWDWNDPHLSGQFLITLGLPLQWNIQPSNIIQKNMIMEQQLFNAIYWDFSVFKHGDFPQQTVVYQRALCFFPMNCGDFFKYKFRLPKGISPADIQASPLQNSGASCCSCDFQLIWLVLPGHAKLKTYEVTWAPLTWISSCWTMISGYPYILYTSLYINVFSKRNIVSCCVMLCHIVSYCVIASLPIKSAVCCPTSAVVLLYTINICLHRHISIIWNMIVDTMGYIDLDIYIYVYTVL